MVAQCYLYLLLLLSLVGTSCGAFLGDILTGQVSALDVASALVGILTGFPSAITLFSMVMGLRSVREKWLYGTYWRTRR